MEDADIELCGICLSVPEDAVQCSQCTKWLCRRCFIQWKGLNKCPYKCQGSEFPLVPIERQIANNFRRGECQTCGETMPAHLLKDHDFNHLYPELCFYHSECRGFGAFTLRPGGPEFCSDPCAEAFEVGASRPAELAKDLRENIKGHRPLFEEAGLLPPGPLKHLPLPGEAAFALHQNSDVGFRQLGPVEFEFARQGRFFCSLYGKKPLDGPATLFLTLTHDVYFKIGYCAAPSPGEQRCFSDHSSGLSFVSCGQLREEDSSTGRVICPPLPSQTLRLKFELEPFKNKFTIFDLDRSETLPLQIQFSKPAFAKPYLALAFKKPQVFRMKLLEREV